MLCCIVKNIRKIYDKKTAAVVEIYGNNILGFTVLPLKVTLQLNTVISLTDIMLIYQPIKVRKFVLYL